MFGWLKRTSIPELKKILFQNNMAAEQLQIYFEHKGDHEAVVILQAYAEESRQIGHSFYANYGKLSGGDKRIILDINRKMRRLFDEIDANGAEAKPRKAFGRAPKTSNFDETFKPLYGWDNL